MLQDSEKQSDVVRGWSYLSDRFGIKREDLGYLELKKVSGDLWLTSNKINSIKDLEFKTQGIRALRLMDIGIKPTTYCLQFLEHYISKNKFEVNQEQFIKLLDREMIEVQMEEKGYVAIEYQGGVIGCGFYKDQKISSRIPKGRNKELKQIVNQP